MASNAERMHALFLGSESAHGTHGVPTQDPGSPKWAIKTTAATPRGPATPALWEEHISGHRPLGVIPIRRNGDCYWASIDRDDYNINFVDVVGQVERLKLPLVPCVSKSGGLHLFLFLTDPAPAVLVRRYLTDIVAAMGWSGTEIFPKQTQVLTDSDVGNWIVMPYFGDTFDSKLRLQHGLKKTGGEQTIEEFLNFAESSKIGLDQLNKSHRRSAGVQSGQTRKTLSVEPFDDGPPCLQHLATSGVTPGMQSNTLLMMGIYYKRVYPGEWKEWLERANSTMLAPPGSAEGLMTVIRSLDKKDYFYTCKTEPMVSHCNSSLCRARKFGVGRGGATPIISGMSKLDTDPPIWYVDVEEARLEVSTDVLQNYMKFHAACMEKLNKCYSMMKQMEWLETLGEAMGDITILDVPQEVGRTGIFFEYLEEFLTNRQRGESREDILRGRPWEDQEGGRHYFQLKDLAQFMKREGERDIKRTFLVINIKRVGGDNKFLNIKKEGRYCWWVPNNIFKHKETPSDPPPIKGVPI